MTERPRAFIVVTGSELVRGDRNDLNGPFLAAELLRLGIEPARISIVGDAEEELAEALSEGLHADLCVISGGLGGITVCSMKPGKPATIVPVSRCQ